MHDIRARRDDLRRRRVELRKAIEERQRHLALRSGDPFDGRQRLAQLEMQLRSTQTEWVTLQTLLGEPVSRPAVRLSKAVRYA